MDQYCWHQNHYLQKNIFRGVKLWNVIDYICIMKFSRELICVMQWIFCCVMWSVPLCCLLPRPPLSYLCSFCASQEPRKWHLPTVPLHKKIPGFSGPITNKNSGRNELNVCNRLHYTENCLGNEFCYNFDAKGTSLRANFWRTLRAIGPYELPWKQGKGDIGPYEFPLKLMWTNGSQISLKVLVYTGIGP